MWFSNGINPFPSMSSNINNHIMYDVRASLLVSPSIWCFYFILLKQKRKQIIIIKICNSSLPPHKVFIKIEKRLLQSTQVFQKKKISKKLSHNWFSRTQYTQWWDYYKKVTVRNHTSYLWLSSWTSLSKLCVKLISFVENVCQFFQRFTFWISVNI